MTTILAAPPSTAGSISRFSPSVIERDSIPRQYAAKTSPVSLSLSAPSAPKDSNSRQAKAMPRSNVSPEAGPVHSSPSTSQASAEGRSSPRAIRAPAAIEVKKEPGSPSLASSRHRPRRLDLSSSMSGTRAPQTSGSAAPLTSKESAGLAIKDLGVACLSPGFQTHDPAMREQLQRSLDVREQQRQLIEARQKGGKGPALQDGAELTQRGVAEFGAADSSMMTSRRKGPPPGLSIHAPSAASFTHERVIQSAPIHQSFTGLRPHHPSSHHPSNLGQTSHIHHLPATQTANRLPPIADVFAHDLAAPVSASLRTGFPSAASPSLPPPLHSPSYPPPQHQAAPHSGRDSEFRSAEEAVARLSGGREDLLPKIVHYGGVQPPTPPSPFPGHYQQPAHGAPQPHAPGPYARGPYSQGQYSHYADPRADARPASMPSARRRTRDEYEREQGGSPGGQQSESKRYARDEEDWRTGLSGREKREEFLRLCERAWDLFHS